MTGAALGMLVAVLVTTTGLAAAATLRIAPVSELALAAYVLGFGQVVVLVLVLSPFGYVRGPALLAGLALSCAVSVGAWFWRGRPLADHAGLRRVVRVMRSDPPLALLAVFLTIALAYTAALIVGTPPNNGDALAYHLSRAAFWRQAGGVGYISDAYDERMNVFPPHGEIVLTLLMEITRSERATGFVQFAAALACAVGVWAIARRLGLPTREAAFGALLFLTLPLVVLQASTTQNDLVVASLLVAATVFLLGTSRAHVGLAALAVALAAGTKILALFALPLLIVVAFLAHPNADRRSRLIALAAGCVVGSYWYGVNVLRDGRPFGELPEQHPVVLHLQENVLTAYAFLLDTFDVSGALGADVLVYVVVAALIVVAATVARNLPFRTSGMLVVVVPVGVLACSYAIWKGFTVLDDVLEAPTGRFPATQWPAPTRASESFSWFGPVGWLLGWGIGVAAIILARRRSLPRIAFVLAAAPLAWLVLLSLVIAYDKSEGRYFLFPVALAASLWGLVLRVPRLAWATAALAVMTAALSLVHFEEKPSGVRLFERRDTPPTVWGAERWEVQSVHLPKTPPSVLRFLDGLPRDAGVALALSYNNFGYPAFGPRFERQVELIPSGSDARPSESQWLLANPSRAREIDRACWRVVFETPGGWTGFHRTEGAFASPARRVSPASETC